MLVKCSSSWSYLGKAVGEVVSRRRSEKGIKRTGWCCQFGGESTEAQGGSASAPWQASAWFGKTCGSVEKKELAIRCHGSKALEASRLFDHQHQPHLSTVTRRKIFSYSVEATSSIMKSARDRVCVLRGRRGRGCPYRHGDGVDGRVGQSLPNGDRISESRSNWNGWIGAKLQEGSGALGRNLWLCTWRRCQFVPQVV